jgi:hypothetical protein
VKTVHLQSQLPDATVEGLEGQFLDKSAYDGQPVAEDAVVYKPNGDVLFKLVRNALPLDLCKTAWKALRSVSADASHRMVASGGASPRANGVSDVVGFLDRTGRHGLDYCRLTGWSMGNPDRFAQAFPFFQEIDWVFRVHMPERHAAQMAKVRETDPAFVIHHTAFTTVTVNKNFRTGVHTDSGDLKEGFGVITCLCAGEFSGGELIFPKYRVAVRFGTQDVLLCDVHEYHANGPIVGVEGQFERMSCVFYYRSGMVGCGSPAEELERLKNRKVIVVNGQRKAVTR